MRAKIRAQWVLVINVWGSIHDRLVSVSFNSFSALNFQRYQFQCVQFPKISLFKMQLANYPGIFIRFYSNAIRTLVAMAEYFFGQCSL